MSVFRRDGESHPEPSNYLVPRALTAAATQLKIGDKGEAEAFRKRRSSATAAWQSEAWEYYDEIGEIKQAFNLVASIVSRIRLYVAVVEDPGMTPAELSKVEGIDPDLAAAAARALDRLDASYGGQAGLLRDASLNLSVTGECYLVQVPERPGNKIPESWDIRSIDELQIDSRNNYSIIPRRDLAGGASSSSSTTDTGHGIIKLPKGSFVGRIWRPHPRYTDDADGSLRSLLALCEELLLLNRTFRAVAKSRLNAGAMFVPDGISVAATADPDVDPDADVDEPTLEELADDFEENLIQAMITPIQDEDSASAIAPLIIRGPTELGEKIKLIKFERAFDATLVKRAEQVLDRILQGLDIPKDVITGMAEVKYSNSVQINESLFRAHIEPMVLVVADSLTKMYLRPYLLAQGFDEVDIKRIVIWYDPSAVSTRNDRAADADAGYEKGVISAATWRQMHGFSDSDAPSATEIGLRLLTEKGGLSPELTEALLGAVAPELMKAVRAQSQAGSPAPIPGNVQEALSGAPADPNADPAALAEPGTGGAAPVDGIVAPAGPPVEPGVDGPPVPLAEPSTSQEAPGDEPAN